MQKSKKCSSFLIRCLGCKKSFVDIAHLNNHQKQQSIGSSCIHGQDKMDHVQTLNFQSPIFNPTCLTGNNKRSIFSIEQPYASHSTTTTNCSSNGSSLTKINQLYMEETSKPLFNNGFNKINAINSIPTSSSNEFKITKKLRTSKINQTVGITNTGLVYNNRTSFLENDSSSDYLCDIDLDQTTEFYDNSDQNFEENVFNIPENIDCSINLNSSKPISSYIYDRINFTKKQRSFHAFSPIFLKI